MTNVPWPAWVTLTNNWYRVFVTLAKSPNPQRMIIDSYRRGAEELNKVYFPVFRQVAGYKFDYPA